MSTVCSCIPLCLENYFCHVQNYIFLFNCFLFKNQIRKESPFEKHGYFPHFFQSPGKYTKFLQHISHLQNIRILLTPLAFNGVEGNSIELRCFQHHCSIEQYPSLCIHRRYIWRQNRCIHLNCRIFMCATFNILRRLNWVHCL